jgi:hypothetical protein
MRIRRDEVRRGPIGALRSLYERRHPGSAVAERKVVVAAGEIIGIEVDDDFLPRQPCCDDPLACERQECWRPWPFDPPAA